MNKNTLSILFPLSLVTFAASLTLFMNPKEIPTKEVITETEKKLSFDQDYYVFVSRAEAFPQQVNGQESEEWDKAGTQAPDLFYEIDWNGTTVFTSDVRQDCQVGHWRGIKLPLSLNQIQNLVNGSMQIDIEVEEMIAAASIRASQEDIISVRLYDKDLMSHDDLVHEWSIPAADLKDGENTFTCAENATATGCRSMTLRMVSRQGSIQDFLVPLLREMNLKPQEEKKS